MSQDSVERLLGRLITDAGFRAEAAVSLVNICRREGYDLTAGELRMLERIDVKAFEMKSLQINPGLRRAGRAS